MINVNNLNYTYKEGNIGLKNINLEFKKGEITMIIGTNGSGKSTLLSCIANLSKYKGLITLDNVDIKKIKNNLLKKKIGIVFQNPNNGIILNNVYDDMKFTLDNLKEENIDNKIKESLKLVGMEKYINSNPYNLSMGEKQRIALANTLSSKKEFLLLDEVTSMVDYNGKQEIYKLILKLKEDNIGVIMTTNIVDELIFADNIVIINNNHEINGIYQKKEIFNDLNLLRDFYIPFKFKLINKIVYNKLKDLSDEEILLHVNE